MSLKGANRCGPARRLLCWLPAIAWMAVIFYFSSQTQNDLHRLFPFLPDLNWGHVGEYFVLGMLYRFALAANGAARPGPWAVVFSALYGASDEYHQRFVPTREPDLKDLVADTAGAVLAVVVWCLTARRLGKSAATRTRPG